MGYVLLCLLLNVVVYAASKKVLSNRQNGLDRTFEPVNNNGDILRFRRDLTPQDSSPLPKVTKNVTKKRYKIVIKTKNRKRSHRIGTVNSNNNDYENDNITGSSAYEYKLSNTSSNNYESKNNINNSDLQYTRAWISLNDYDYNTTTDSYEYTPNRLNDDFSIASGSTSNYEHSPSSTYEEPSIKTVNTSKEEYISSSADNIEETITTVSVINETTIGDDNSSAVYNNNLVNGADLRYEKDDNYDVVKEYEYENLLQVNNINNNISRSIGKVTNENIQNNLDQDNNPSNKDISITRSEHNPASNSDIILTETHYFTEDHLLDNDLSNNNTVLEKKNDTIDGNSEQENTSEKAFIHANKSDSRVQNSIVIPNLFKTYSFNKHHIAYDNYYKTPHKNPPKDESTLGYKSKFLKASCKNCHMNIIIQNYKPLNDINPPKTNNLLLLDEPAKFESYLKILKNMGNVASSIKRGEENVELNNLSGKSKAANFNEEGFVLPCDSKLHGKKRDTPLLLALLIPSNNYKSKTFFRLSDNVNTVTDSDEKLYNIDDEKLSLQKESLSKIKCKNNICDKDTQKNYLDISHNISLMPENGSDLDEIESDSDESGSDSDENAYDFYVTSENENKTIDAHLGDYLTDNGEFYETSEKKVNSNSLQYTPKVHENTTLYNEYDISVTLPKQNSKEKDDKYKESVAMDDLVHHSKTVYEDLYDDKTSKDNVYDLDYSSYSTVTPNNFEFNSYYHNNNNDHSTDKENINKLSTLSDPSKFILELIAYAEDVKNRDITLSPITYDYSPYQITQESENLITKPDNFDMINKNLQLVNNFNIDSNRTKDSKLLNNLSTTKSFLSTEKDVISSINSKNTNETKLHSHLEDKSISYKDGDYDVLSSETKVKTYEVNLNENNNINDKIPEYLVDKYTNINKENEREILKRRSETLHVYNADEKEVLKRKDTNKSENNDKNLVQSQQDISNNANNINFSYKRKEDTNESIHRNAIQPLNSTNNSENVLYASNLDDAVVSIQYVNEATPLHSRLAEENNTLRTNSESGQHNKISITNSELEVINDSYMNSGNMSVPREYHISKKGAGEFTDNKYDLTSVNDNNEDNNDENNENIADNMSSDEISVIDQKLNDSSVNINNFKTKNKKLVIVLEPHSKKKPNIIYKNVVTQHDPDLGDVSNNETINYSDIINQYHFYPKHSLEERQVNETLIKALPVYKNQDHTDLLDKYSSERESVGEKNNRRLIYIENDNEKKLHSYLTDNNNNIKKIMSYTDINYDVHSPENKIKTHEANLNKNVKTNNKISPEYLVDEYNSLTKENISKINEQSEILYGYNTYENKVLIGEDQNKSEDTYKYLSQIQQDIPNNANNVNLAYNREEDSNQTVNLNDIKPLYNTNNSENVLYASNLDDTIVSVQYINVSNPVNLSLAENIDTSHENNIHETNPTSHQHNKISITKTDSELINDSYMNPLTSVNNNNQNYNDENNQNIADNRSSDKISVIDKNLNDSSVNINNFKTINKKLLILVLEPHSKDKYNIIYKKVLPQDPGLQDVSIKETISVSDPINQHHNYLKHVLGVKVNETLIKVLPVENEGHTDFLEYYSRERDSIGEQNNRRFDLNYNNRNKIFTNTPIEEKSVFSNYTLYETNPDHINDETHLEINDHPHINNVIKQTIGQNISETNLKYDNNFDGVITEFTHNINKKNINNGNSHDSNKNKNFNLLHDNYTDNNHLHKTISDISLDADLNNKLVPSISDSTPDNKYNKEIIKNSTKNSIYHDLTAVFDSEAVKDSPNLNLHGTIIKNPNTYYNDESHDVNNDKLMSLKIYDQDYLPRGENELTNPNYMVNHNRDPKTSHLNNAQTLSTELLEEHLDFDHKELNLLPTYKKDDLKHYDSKKVRSDKVQSLKSDKLTISDQNSKKIKFNLNKTLQHIVENNIEINGNDVASDKDKEMSEPLNLYAYVLIITDYLKKLIVLEVNEIENSLKNITNEYVDYLLGELSAPVVNNIIIKYIQAIRYIIGVPDSSAEYSEYMDDKYLSQLLLPIAKYLKGNKNLEDESTLVRLVSDFIYKLNHLTRMFSLFSDNTKNKLLHYFLLIVKSNSDRLSIVEGEENKYNVKENNIKQMQLAEETRIVNTYFVYLTSIPAVRYIKEELSTMNLKDDEQFSKAKSLLVLLGKSISNALGNRGIPKELRHQIILKIMWSIFGEATNDYYLKLDFATLLNKYH